jgi:hypothetical protein
VNRVININIDIELHEEIHYEELAYVIMKAEKTHNLKLASWRQREASGVLLIQTLGPDYQRTWDLSPGSSLS